MSDTETGETLAQSATGEWLKLTIQTEGGDVTFHAHVTDNASERAGKDGLGYIGGDLMLDLEVKPETVEKLETDGQIFTIHSSEPKPGEFSEMEISVWGPYRDDSGRVIDDWTTLGTVTDVAVTTEPEGEDDD